MTHASEVLRDVFGFDEFRPGQKDIVDAVAQGENVLAIMPTGGGKSLCYQLPALLRDGVTIVVSPLIALMRDQVRALRSIGVGAGALTSTNTQEENDAIFAGLEDGSLRLLYLAPERLGSAQITSVLSRYRVGMISVDEAHCVSQWGHDFRPDYLKIGELRRQLGVSLSAFTATADVETRAEIVTRLFDDHPPKTFLRGFDRPNIHLAFVVKNNPRRQIVDYADARRGQSGIVYCGTRSKTERWRTGFLRIAKAVDAKIFVAAFDFKTKRIVLDKFFQPSDDMQKDLENLKIYYQQYTGKIPENF